MNFIDIFSCVRNRPTVRGAVHKDIKFTRPGGHLERKWINTDRREKGLEHKFSRRIQHTKQFDTSPPPPPCTSYVQTLRLY